MSVKLFREIMHLLCKNRWIPAFAGMTLFLCCLLSTDAFAQSLNIPHWAEPVHTLEDLAELQLYYTRLGFIVSGYVNQLDQAPCTQLPKNLALPFCEACQPEFCWTGAVPVRLEEGGDAQGKKVG